MNCRNKITSLALVLVGSCYGLTASAKCGSVDYTQGADALAMMHDYVVTMMLYVQSADTSLSQPSWLTEEACT